MVLITLIAAVGGLLFGFDTGIISGALIFLQRSFELSTLAKEVVVSSVVLGALLGAIISGSVADRFGRRTMLIVSSLLFLLGTALATFASSLVYLVAGRLVLGFAIGISSYTVPLYISEMAPAAKRGRLVLLSSIAITGGQAVAFISDYWLAASADWRAMFALGFIPAVMLLLGLLFVPATPRWLVLKGKLQQAKHVVSRFNHDVSVSELVRMQADQDMVSKVSMSGLFRSPLRGVLVIGLMLGILQQFCGINTVMYYGPFIFKAAGFKGVHAQIMATFVLGLVNTAMTVVTVYTVDYFGRRALLKGGMLLAMISLLFVGFLFKVSAGWVHWAMIVGLVCYIAGYAISLGSLFWLIIAEIYPLSMRTRAMSFVTAMQWAANFVVAMTFLTILNHVGASVTFWMYASVCLFAIIFAHFWLPETKQVSLERIQHNLLSGKRLRDLGVG